MTCGQQSTSPIVDVAFSPAACLPLDTGWSCANDIQVYLVSWILVSQVKENNANISLHLLVILFTMNDPMWHIDIDRRVHI